MHPKVPQNLLRNRSDLDAIAQGLWRRNYPRPNDLTPDGQVLWDFLLEHVLPACPRGGQKLPMLVFPYGSPEHLWCVWDALASVRDLDFSKNTEAAALLLWPDRWLKNPVSRIPPRYNLPYQPNPLYEMATSCVGTTVNTGVTSDTAIIGLVADVAIRADRLRDPDVFVGDGHRTSTYLRLRLLAMLSRYLDRPNPVW